MADAHAKITALLTPKPPALHDHLRVLADDAAALALLGWPRALSLDLSHALATAAVTAARNAAPDPLAAAEDARARAQAALVAEQGRDRHVQLICVHAELTELLREVERELEVLG